MVLENGTSNKEESGMEVMISPSLITKAKAILDSGEFLDRAEISLGEGGPVAILSADPESIISLHKLTHDKKTYYLGLPKE